MRMEKSATILRRVLRSNFAVALLASILTITWLSSHWTNDYEEIPTFAYSLGQTDRNTFRALGNYAGGEFSLAGVALYDAKQGLGVRLPTQGAWAQNPLGFLRHFLDIESIILIRLFMSLFQTVWVVSFTIATFGGKANHARRIIASSIIAAIAPSLVGHTDWSSAVVFNWSCIALFASLIAREHSGISKDYEAVLDLVIGIATINLVTEHPGWIPMAMVFLGSTIAIVLFQRTPRPNVAMLIAGSRRASWIVAILGAATANLLVVYVDFRAALGGLPSSSFAQGLGAGSEAGYLGFSRGALPWQLEYLLTQAMVNTFLPVLWLFRPELSQFEIVYQLLNTHSARNAFLALAALPLLLFIRRSNSYTATLRTTRAALLALIATFAYAVFQDIGVIPPLMKTSGSWIVSRGVAGSVAVLLCIVLGQNFSRQNRIIKVSASLGLSLSLLLALFNFGVLNPVRIDKNQGFSSLLDSRTKLSIKERSNAVAPTVSDLKSRSTRRLLFVESDDLTPLELARYNFTVVAPLFPKVRSTRPLADLPANVGLYYARNFDLSNEQYAQRVLDFLNIDTLGVQIEEFGSCEESQYEGLVLRCIGEVTFTDRFATYSLESFSSFTLDRLITTPSSCAILEFTCPTFERAVAHQARKEPRLKLCEDSCLIEFDFDIDVSHTARWLLVPMRYDTALRIQDPVTGKEVAAVNSGGFVAVSTRDLKPMGTLQILVRPDKYMIARAILSHANVLILMLLVIRVIRPTLFGLDLGWSRHRKARRP
jgi:hypothetical protein